MLLAVQLYFMDAIRARSMITVPFNCNGSDLMNVFQEFQLFFTINETNFSLNYTSCSPRSLRFVAENLQCGTIYSLYVSTYLKFPNQKTVTCSIYTSTIATESCN